MNNVWWHPNFATREPKEVCLNIKHVPMHAKRNDLLKATLTPFTQSGNFRKLSLCITFIESTPHHVMVRVRYSLCPVTRLVESDVAFA